MIDDGWEEAWSRSSCRSCRSERERRGYWRVPRVCMREWLQVYCDWTLARGARPGGGRAAKAQGTANGQSRRT